MFLVGFFYLFYLMFDDYVLFLVENLYSQEWFKDFLRYIKGEIMGWIYLNNYIIYKCINNNVFVFFFFIKFIFFCIWIVMIFCRLFDDNWQCIFCFIDFKFNICKGFLCIFLMCIFFLFLFNFIFMLCLFELGFIYLMVKRVKDVKKISYVYQIKVINILRLLNNFVVNIVFFL